MSPPGVESHRRSGSGAAEGRSGPPPAPGGRGPEPTRPANMRLPPAPGGPLIGAPSLGRTGPDGRVDLRVHALCGIPPAVDRIAAVQTTPGRAAVSRPPAGTARARGHRSVLLPEPHSPW